MDRDGFTPALFRPPEELPPPPPPRRVPRGTAAAALFLAALALACLLCPLLLPPEAALPNLARSSLPPSRESWFGTDTLGRDIFSMIWYGGRVSLTVGLLSAALAALLALVLGAAGGLAPRRLDGLLTRLTDILLSLPELLLILLIQALLGDASVWSLSLAIGAVSWPAMAKAVRTQVRRLRHSGYVTASRCMGGGFFHILRRHLAPNVLPSILFMAVMNIRGAIAAEAALSFLGMGLPLDTVSWGGMLSLSQSALLGGAWWMVLIPGGFLIAALVCVTEIGGALLSGGEEGPC